MKALIFTIFLSLFTGCIFTPPPNSEVVDIYQDSYDDNDLVTAVALEELGVRYRYGGNSPSEGFDCSGFVCYVYKKAKDKKLPRTAEQQSKYVMALDKDELEKGDLVFFDTHDSGRISHCGIYMGKDRFIHATSGKAYRVTISSLNSPHYKRAFRWGGRVIR